MTMSTLDPQRSTIAQVWNFKGDADEYEALLHRTARAFPRSTPVMICWGVDLLTKTPWWVIPLFWYPLCISAVITGIELGASSWTAVAGVSVWPVLEYVMHRFIFHHKPGTRVSRTLSYSLHGLHHAFPNDKYRLVLPVTLSVPWSFLYMFVCMQAMSPPAALTFTAGTATSYATYDILHYVIHHMHRVRRWRLFAAAKHRHINLHHMRNWDADYGITTGVVDSVIHHINRRRDYK